MRQEQITECERKETKYVLFIQSEVTLTDVLESKTLLIVLFG